MANCDWPNKTPHLHLANYDWSRKYLISLFAQKPLFLFKLHPLYKSKILFKQNPLHFILFFTSPRIPHLAKSFSFSKQTLGILFLLKDLQLGIWTRPRNRRGSLRRFSSTSNSSGTRRNSNRPFEVSIFTHQDS